MAVIVALAIVAAFISCLPELFTTIVGGSGIKGLNEVLEIVFSIIIGVEFLKMLLKPTADTVIEVLIFLIARHMIVEPTTVLENLFSVISISILFGVGVLLRHLTKKWGTPDGPADAAEERRTADEDGADTPKDPR